MKKKAIISAAASVALAGVMCVGFAACGDTAKSLKGEEVTQEQWNAAFDEELFNNFKIEAESTTETSSGGTTLKMTTSMTLEFDEGKTYAKGKIVTSISGELPAGAQISDGTVELEYYVDETGSETKYFAKVDGNWALVENEDYMYQSGSDIVMLIYDAIGSNDYEDFEYSADNKGYVAKDAEEGELMVLKFKDGKLAALYGEISEGSESVSMSSVHSYMITYGGQSITLPTVA